MQKGKNYWSKNCPSFTKNDFNWEFNLVEDEQANAFCLPGEKLLYTQEF